MKKLLSIFLALLCLLTCCSLSASAVSLDAGITALRATFQKGDDPATNPDVNFDYMYFSPVKGNNDKTKYPLMVWLHGQFSGYWESLPLNNTNIANFASDEMQGRIVGTEGMFIYIPRDPSVADFIWRGNHMELKSDILRFVEKYKKNIDMDRIYCGGYSLGGLGTYRVVSVMPKNYFAAVFLLSPVHTPSDEEIYALKDTPVWITSARNDWMVSHETITDVWTRLNAISTVPHKNRWSLFEYPTKPDGSPVLVFVTNHDTWAATNNDLFWYDGSDYHDMTTINGNGYPVKLVYPKGFLYWLSSQGYDGDPTGGDINNPSSGIPSVDLSGSIFKKIIEIFKMLIKIIMG